MVELLEPLHWLAARVAVVVMLRDLQLVQRGLLGKDLLGVLAHTRPMLLAAVVAVVELLVVLVTEALALPVVEELEQLQQFLAH